MTAPISDVDHLLRDLRPELHARTVAFCRLPPHADTESIPWLGFFREAEGITVVVYDDVAAGCGWEVVFRAAWITLNVNSDFQAVGLTAAVAAALTTAGISCNVIAAVHHDHVFVPVGLGETAVQVLQRLQQGGRATH